MMHPPYEPDSPLAWENYVACQVAQAALGLLSPSILDLACRIGQDSIELHLVAEGDVVDDVENICFELDVLLEGAAQITTHIHPATSALDWSDATLRGVYSAKRTQ